MTPTALQYDQNIWFHSPALQSKKEQLTEHGSHVGLFYGQPNINLGAFKLLKCNKMQNQYWHAVCKMCPQKGSSQTVF